MHWLQGFCSPIASLTGSPLFKCFSLQPSIIWVAYGLCVHNHVVLRTDILVEVVESRLWLCNVYSVLCSVSMLYATHCVPCAVLLAPDVRRRSATCFMFPPIHLQGRPHFPIADWDLALITTWIYPLWLVGFRFRPMKYFLLFYQYILCRL